MVFVVASSFLSSQPSPLTYPMQIEADRAEMEALRMSASSAVTAHTDGLEGQADNSVELRRLRVELDKKSSEVDTVLKEAADVRAELKEMKAMLSKAEAGADAAGADEDSLRKRLSQLVCENGLLKGEKERYEALAASATSESRSSSSRAAAETDRLEREVEQLKERADKVSGIAADGDRAKAALGMMETKLAEVRQERAELQVIDCVRSAGATCYFRLLFFRGWSSILSKISNHIFFVGAVLELSIARVGVRGFVRFVLVRAHRLLCNFSFDQPP